MKNIERFSDGGIPARDYQLAMQDLYETRPGPGLAKATFLGLVFGVLCYLAMTSSQPLAFLGFAVAAGVVGAAWMFLTHDAMHHTLTGWVWFDEVAPRILTSPFFWFHGLYSEVHKLHHKMNGDDVNDPERVQWTQEEYEKASPIVRFYVRHQWVFDILVFAGFGMIFRTLSRGLKLYKRSRRVRRQLWLDVIAMVVANTIIYSLAFHYGVVVKTLVLWLVLERVVGTISQWRAQIEHYGLWGRARHFFETQAYNCRNLRTNRFAAWYFNYLNFHSVHHAFARIPFYNLEVAHGRLAALHEQRRRAQPAADTGYLATTLSLARRPTVISRECASRATGQRAMVRI